MFVPNNIAFRLSALAQNKNLTSLELLENLLHVAEEEEAWILYQSERAPRETNSIKDHDVFDLGQP